MPELRLPAFAPETLTQTINPWSWVANLTAVRFGQVNVYMGDTSNPELERSILESVGTYGRQIGQMGDALAVLVRRLDRRSLAPDELEAIEALEDQLRKVDRIKNGAGVKPTLAARQA